MDPSTEGEGNLLEIMDLARTLRQEQLFIQHEQASFANLIENLSSNSTAITRLGYICAQQRQNLNDLITSRPGAGPVSCCRRASGLENAKFVDAKKMMDYEHAILYEELFNYLYRSPYLLALSLSTADRIPAITPQHVSSIIHTITAGLYGNAINTKDVEMLLKLLRELIEIQIVVSENPRRLLRAHSSAFARLYQRLNESMFSAKIFLTSALFEPIMKVLVDNDLMLDVDPNKVIQNLTPKERFKRFGEESSNNYQQKVQQFHANCISKLHFLASAFIESLTASWSLFPSTLRWLVQTMFHHLKQARFADKTINEIITDMVFTHFICPAVVSPDIMGIIDAPISEQVRLNLVQIGQIIQMLALTKHDEVDSKFAELYAKFESNLVTKLIDLLLVSRSGEDVVAILSQQSDFERSHLLSTQSELAYFVDFFQTLLASDEYDIPREDRDKLDKILSHLPADANNVDVGRAAEGSNTDSPSHSRERSKQSLMSLSKATKSKIAKSISFSATATATTVGAQGGGGCALANGNITGTAANSTDGCHTNQGLATSTALNNSISLSPTRPLATFEGHAIEPILIFNIYNSDENKLQPLTEEEVLKMNSIGQEMANGEAALGGDAESCNMDQNNDKSSVVFDGIDTMSDDVLRPLHAKQTRFSISHDDASIGNSDILEAVSEAPSNHSVTSSLELEENDQNDNLSDMVSANVSGRGTPNISGRDTPSSQVTDGESVHNVMPTPQMQKLLSKARSDIEDKFCKFEIKKQIEGDETVSILSDTWSTDVLASDSETFDANERDRDRNLSTPLIPSSVVLPGDNNYDVLAGSGSGRGTYLDAGDQHSESNWSTDVLVSDSEKLGEPDTDDILNLTSRSDLTDADVRSETQRETLPTSRDAPVGAENASTRTAPRLGDDSKKAARSNNTNYHTLNFDDNSAASAGGPIRDDSPGADNDSDRSQEDSAFFDAVNSYEDAATTSNDAVGSKLTSAGPQNYERLSSLARSSVRTTNQYTGENSFQQNYKSTHYNRDKMQVAFLAAMPRMHRQTSAESSISNQSAILEDQAGTKPKASVCDDLKTKLAEHPKCDDIDDHDCKDLIDFSDFAADAGEAPQRIDDVDCAAAAEGCTNAANEEGDGDVIRRRVSTEQRSAVFDGRRNGILAVKGGSEGATNSTPATSRRHQSLNYENHEIIITQPNAPKRVSMLPSLKNYAPETDDFKSQHRQKQQNEEEMLLVAKTERLQLNNDVSAAQNATAAEGNGLVTCQKAKSTGAIPKSISFDASADKTSGNISSPRLSLSHRLHLDSFHSPAVHHTSASRSGIFNKLKQGFFKHRRNNKPAARHHSTNMSEDFLSPIHNMRGLSFRSNAAGDTTLEGISGMSPAEPGSSAARSRNIATTFCDINEDILAKYRRKVSTSSEATNSDSAGNSFHRARQVAEMDARIGNSTHHDKTALFNNIKKKIRTVLSKTDLHTGDFRHTTCSKASPLLTYLQIQSAQAMNMQNFHQISYVSEAIRCLSSLEPQQHQQLLEELQTDIERRQNYLQYLMRHRQNLLLIMENIEQFESRLRSESSTCNRHLMAVCVRLFLEKREPKILHFQEEFRRLTVSDDKIDLIEEFMDGLIEELLGTEGFLHGITSTEWQVHEARDSIERILLRRMYQQVMFPNDDADLLRDSVLSEHIVKLQRIIHPLHPALNISQEYLAEAPWVFAQQQISFISAYNTPREKLQCVIRCISSIMSLLHMSSGRIPAADDLLPVLIYVVIMANPPYLLSTVEYITCFIGDKMAGEEQFHWTLFESVVQFIKTMDYLD